MTYVFAIAFAAAILAVMLGGGWLVMDQTLRYERPPSTHHGYMRWLESEQRKVAAKRTRDRRYIAMALIVLIALLMTGLVLWVAWPPKPDPRPFRSDRNRVPNWVPSYRGQP